MTTASAMPDRLRLDADGSARLLGRRCAECGAAFHGAPEFCRRCTSPRLEAVELAGDGEVFSFTYVRRASRDWAGPVPYALAEVIVGDGVMIAARILDWPDGPDVEIGQRVRVAADAVGEDGAAVAVYGWRRDG